MRLAVLGVALAGCTSGSLEGGRYACDPKQDRAVDSAQCPGQWRCGLEGFCHQANDARTPWLCEVDVDCELGFHCGLAASRERRECHNPDAPQAFACAVDTDCVGGWRCAADGKCVDPRFDVLYGGDALAATGEVRLNPLDPRPFDKVSVSPVWTTTTGKTIELIASQRGDTLEALVIDQSAPSFTTYTVAETGVRALIAQGARSLREGSFGGSLLDERPRFYASLIDGGMNCYTLHPTGMVVAEPVDYFDDPDLYTPGIDVTRFKHATGAADQVPGFVALNDNPADGFVRVFGPDGFWFNDVFAGEDGYADFDAVPNNHVRDMAVLDTDAGVECIFATDDRGLWVAQRDYNNNFDFDPLLTATLGNTECPGTTGLGASRLQSLGSNWLAVETVPPGGGDRQLTLVDVTEMTERGGIGASHCTSINGTPCEADDRIPSRTELGPCAACPGSTLLDFAITLTETGPGLDVRCGSASGASSFFHLSRRPGSAAAQCERRVVLGQSSLFTESAVKSVAQPVPGLVAWSGPQGQLWLGATAATAASFTFDRAPDGMALKGTDPRDFLAFTGDVVGLPVSAFGIVSTQSLGLVAAVSAEPHWALQGTALVDLATGPNVSDARTLAIVTQAAPSAPFAAARARSRDDTRVAVITAGGQLFAVDLEKTLAGIEPFAVAPLRLALVNQILSLAMPSTRSQGSAWLEGYLLTAAGVQRVVADTPTRWRSEELKLAAQLTPIEVWFERDRGRVGCSDGSVYALPSRVPLAPPISAGAIDFAQTCGQQLVLALDGLYRLDARPGDAVGRWVKLPLPADFAANGLEGGRVHALGPDVYVFTRAGEAARVTFASCP